MKTVINHTHAPVKVAMPRGKFLRIGPGRSGQIRDEDAEHAAIKKLIEAGDLEIVADDAGASGGGGPAARSRGAAQDRGRSTLRQRKGDR